MKRTPPPDPMKQKETIATFGAAKIVEYLDGTMEIEGGSEEDQRQAKEWANKFLGGLGKKQKRG